MQIRILRFARKGIVGITWCGLLLLATALPRSCDAIEVKRGIQYGIAEGEPLLMDVYLPEESAGERYGVLLIHGGGWARGHRQVPSITEVAQALAEAGYVAFSISYRLVKDGDQEGEVRNRYPAAVDDCRHAVRWIRHHAKDYGIDDKKLGGYDESAGGHLVALLGTTAPAPEPDKKLKGSARLDAVVDVFGPSDLTADFSHLANGFVQNLIDRFVEESLRRDASPLFHVDQHSASFLLVHGTEDPLVPVEQSRKLQAALLKAGRVAEYLEFAGDGHGFSPDNRKILLTKAIGFFDTELRKATSDDMRERKKSPPDNGLGGLFQFHYDNRVRSFREQNLLFHNVVLVGDSITEGFDVQTHFPGRRVLNRGIGGDVIGMNLPESDPRGVLRRLDNSIYDTSPAAVFLMIGINDLNSGRQPEAMEKGYRELLSRIAQRMPQLKLYIQSLLPTRGTFAVRNEAVRDFNRRLRALAEEFGHTYVDLHVLMVDENDELREEYTPDGLHLTSAAYEVWRAEIERRIGWSGAKDR